MVGGVAGAEHPLVARAPTRTLRRTWSASVWKASAVVRGGQGAGEGVARPAGAPGRRGRRRSPPRSGGAGGGCSRRTGSARGAPAPPPEATAGRAGGSGGSRTGRRGPGRARTGCRSARRKRSRAVGLGQQVAPPRPRGRRRRASGRGAAGSAAVMIDASLPGPTHGSSCGASAGCGCGQLALGQQLDQARQHLLAVVPGQGQGELGGQQAVLDADVVAPRAHLQGQVPLARASAARAGERVTGPAPGVVPAVRASRPPRPGPPRRPAAP